MSIRVIAILSIVITAVIINIGGPVFARGYPVRDMTGIGERLTEEPG